MTQRKKSGCLVRDGNANDRVNRDVILLCTKLCIGALLLAKFSV
jgi:hypothetical protein